MVKYIREKEFEDFKVNFDKLIDVLNHNMTKLQVDVVWIKRIGVGIISILGASFIKSVL